MSATLDLAKQLIAAESITPNDAGCQQILAARLAKLGFEIEKLPYADVQNLWAYTGTTKPLFVFAGHTDVVPPGPLVNWTSPPFQPEIRNQKLYGRGSADMKSSIAAMITAIERIKAKHPQVIGSIGLLITSDEEGDSINGTKKVVEYLQKKNISVDYCLIGEATCEQQFGDTIKIGRRGSLSGKLTVFGKQGHIAYPQLANNPIHRALAVLQQLTEYSWDQASEFYQATSFQISNIHAGTGVNNVIPGELVVDFNLRYNAQLSFETITKTIQDLLDNAKIQYHISWNHSGKPFFSPAKKLATALSTAVLQLTEIQSQFSTTGGTSDGRFLIDIAKEIVEFGPINASVHQIDEHINIHDLEKLSAVYEQLLVNLLGSCME